VIEVEVVIATDDESMQWMVGAGNQPELGRYRTGLCCVSEYV
jgi:hypothetical protein